MTRIRTDLSRAATDRRIFDEFASLVRQNASWIDQHHGNVFCDFVLRSYVSSAASVVRRHVKDSKDAVSLVRLLRQLSECAPQIDYERYLRFHSQDHSSPWPPITFGRLSRDGNMVSTELVEADIHDLKASAGQIEAMVDKTIAHLDKKQFDGSVRLEDLSAAIRSFASTAVKYVVFICGDGYQTLEKTFQSDWTRIFRVPFVGPV